MQVFNDLSSVDVSAHVEKKSNFNYLSWAWAWAEVCKKYKATRKIYKNTDGWNYHTDGKTCWVEVGVTIDSVEHIDMLPVMDFRNQSIPLAKVTSFDVNKAIQRATVKAIALHGLGLHIYAGEDLPMTEKEVELITPSQALELESSCESSAMVDYVKSKLGISCFKEIEKDKYKAVLDMVNQIIAKQKKSLVTEIQSFNWKHEKHKINSYNKHLGTLNEYECSIEKLVKFRDHLISNGEESSEDE